MQQQSKEYKGLIQSGIFFAPIIPQLGFVLFLIHLWLKRVDFISIVKHDFQNKLNQIVVGILVLLAIVSTIFTVAPISKSVFFLAYVIVVILGFYSIRLCSLSIPDILKPYVYAVSIFTVFGIFQWLFHIEMIKQVGPLLVNIYFLDGNRISSLAGQPMILAGLSAFGFLFSIMLYFYYNKSNIRYLYLVFGAIAFVSTLLTQSRSMFIVTIIGLVFLLMIYYKQKIIINILVILGVVVFAYLFGEYQDNTLQLISGNKAVQSALPEASGSSAPTTIERFQDKTGSGRTELWKDSITLIKVKPIFGYGPDSWQVAMKRLVGDKYKTKYEDISDPSNTFLRLSVDFGVPFAIIFLSFILYKIVSRLLIIKDAPHMLAVGALTLLIMLLGLVDNPLSGIYGNTQLIILAGILWQINKRPYEEEQL